MSGIWRRYTDKKQAFLAPQSPERVPDEGLPAPAKFLSPSMRAWIDADAVVSGRLSFSEPTRIDGTLRGALETRTLVLQDGGRVDGHCRIAPALSARSVEESAERATGTGRGSVK